MKSLKSCMAYAHILAVLSVPAVAQDASQGPYVGFGAGMFFLSDSDGSFDDETLGGIAGIKLDFDTGYALSGALGYRFANGFRVEGEVAYRRNNVDKVSLTVSGVGLPGDVDDHLTNLGFMVNAYQDLQTESGVIPYLGIGLGFNRVGMGAIDSMYLSADHDTVFAYAAMAGVSVPVAESTSLSVEYKYLGTEDPCLDETDFEYESHTFGAKLSYSF